MTDFLLSLSFICFDLESAVCFRSKTDGLFPAQENAGLLYFLKFSKVKL